MLAGRIKKHLDMLPEKMRVHFQEPPPSIKFLNTMNDIVVQSKMADPRVANQMDTNHKPNPAMFDNVLEDADCGEVEFELGDVDVKLAQPVISTVVDENLDTQQVDHAHTFGSTESQEDEHQSQQDLFEEESQAQSQAQTQATQDDTQIADNEDHLLNGSGGVSELTSLMLGATVAASIEVRVIALDKHDIFHVTKMGLTTSMKELFEHAAHELRSPCNNSSFYSIEEKKTRYTVNAKKEAKNADGQVVLSAHDEVPIEECGSQFESCFLCFESKKDC